MTDIADPILTFLESQLTKLAAIQRLSAMAFPGQWISAGFDPERLLREPNFPAVLVNDEGGGVHPANRNIDQRRFSVTIVVHVPQDNLGQEAEKELLRLCGLAMRGDGTHKGLIRDTTNAVASLPEDGVRSLVTESGIMLVSKQLNFRYELARAPEAETV